MAHDGPQKLRRRILGIWRFVLNFFNHLGGLPRLPWCLVGLWSDVGAKIHYWHLSPGTGPWLWATGRLGSNIFFHFLWVLGDFGSGTSLVFGYFLCFFWLSRPSTLSTSSHGTWLGVLLSIADVDWVSTCNMTSYHQYLHFGYAWTKSRAETLTRWIAYVQF